MEKEWELTLFVFLDSADRCIQCSTLTSTRKDTASVTASIITMEIRHVMGVQTSWKESRGSKQCVHILTWVGAGVIKSQNPTLAVHCWQTNTATYPEELLIKKRLYLWPSRETRTAARGLNASSLPNIRNTSGYFKLQTRFQCPIAFSAGFLAIAQFILEIQLWSTLRSAVAPELGYCSF